MDAVLLTLGLVLLLGAGDALVRGAVALSLRLGVPAVLIGATVVGFGTSAPELLITVQAALADAPGIALGNVVGSNIANVFLVLGLPALMASLGGAGADARRNLYVMLGATAVFSLLLLPGTLWRPSGALLAGVCLAMLYDSVRSGMAARAGDERAALAKLAELEDVDPHMATWKVVALIGIGLVGLPLGADFLIDGARGIADTFGISEAVIGLTVVAVGTSLPELATTLAAALRREADVAIGNVVGSNIFNITGIIGIAALVSPLAVPAEILGRDLWWMIGASLVLAPYVWLGRRISRPVGGVLLAVYGFYIYHAFSG
ncbi:MAG TPA: calcium/sodium antiporter [Thermohalobaculum sp.]|nr:calcium/sodium antiporter [Thermohalobaculum sp.]